MQKETHAALNKPKTMTISSSAFVQGAKIPREFTCQGEGVSPPLAFGGAPAGTRALALVVDDPDAPRGTFTHWTAWDVGASATSLPRKANVASVGGIEGTNDADERGYVGPCPPSGSHRYFFRIFALDGPLGLAAGAGPADVWKALDGRTLAWGELMGTYQKA
jgi:hypothetical protein